MVRHAAFRPALDAAAVGLQAWLVAASPVGLPPLLRFALKAHTMSSPSVRSGTSGGTSSGEGSAAVRPDVPVQLVETVPKLDIDNSPAATAVDFAVMHQLKHVTRPKFTWEGATIFASQPQNGGPTPDQVAKKRRVAAGSRIEAVLSIVRDAGPDEEPEVLPSESDCGCEGLLQPLSRGSCKLYDALIVNRGSRDSAAIAAEWHVVMPPHSAFLMSDVTRLSPLMPGKPLPSTAFLF